MRSIKCNRNRIKNARKRSRTYRKKHSKRNRNRNRNQRGGKSKTEWFKELIALYIACDTSRPSVTKALSMLQLENNVAGCNRFKDLLMMRNRSVPTLSAVVCSNLNYDEIKTKETSIMRDRLVDANNLKNWITFVAHLHVTVTKLALGDLPSVPPSKSMTQPAMEEWLPVVEPRPPLPAGWNVFGPSHAPFYVNSITGKSQREVPIMPAEVALRLTNPNYTLEQTLALINDPNYTPPPLTKQDQALAEKSGASLPDVIPKQKLSAYEQLAAWKDD